jgi:2-iminobutanoate/2-iminopropanoate deaminase
VTLPEPLALVGVPDPVGLYSHAVAAPPGAQIVAVAGQLAVDMDGQSLAGNFEEQMRIVLKALDAILRQTGEGLRSVLKFTTYLVDPDDIDRFYAERARLWPTYFPDSKYPANTLLVVQRLVRPEFRIEIEALAAVAAPTDHASTEGR